MTAIEWTHIPGYVGKSWNPVTGCQKIAQGCKNCYAETLAKRFWKDRDFTDVRTHADRLDEPLRRRKPTCYFVNSMSDLFHEAVPLEFIAAVYGVMAACPQHLFIILTKRPKRMREFMGWLAGLQRGHWHGHVGGCWEQLAKYAPVDCDAIDKSPSPWAQAWTRGYEHFHGTEPPKHLGDAGARWPWPLPNVIHGYSAANQADLDAGIADLLATPSATRCLSLEPLVGAVDLIRACHKRHDSAFSPPTFAWHDILNGRKYTAGHKGSGVSAGPDSVTPRVNWIIVGGESGPGAGARPCDVAWIRGIVDQCKAASVPCFVKQLGSEPFEMVADPLALDPIAEPEYLRGRCEVTDRKGGDPSEWPADLRVRQWPDVAITS